MARVDDIMRSKRLAATRVFGEGLDYVMMESYGSLGGSAGNGRSGGE